MHILKKIAPTIIVLIFLVAAADVSIFHRADLAKRLQATVATIPPKFSELIVALLAGLALLTLLIILRGLIRRVLSFADYLWAAPEQSSDGPKPKDRIKFQNDLRANRIQVITVVVQALGGIAVLIGIYFAWANLKTTQEAQEDAQKSQAETIRLTNEGQITDRFTKAIDQLGSLQMDVRVGGIYALERIARDSAKDHWSIMEVLTTFVREHAHVKTEDEPLGFGDARARANKSLPLPPLPIAAAPSPDIQAILTVIGRRECNFEKGKDEHLNLTRTNLRVADLTGAHLESAYLDGAYLDGAHLNGGHQNDAYLNGAHLNDAYLQGAHLNDANLDRAHLTNANLRFAHLNGARLYEAHLEGAYLEIAHLEGAYLTGAYLTGAQLATTHLDDAHLQGAHLTNANLRFAHLNGADLNGADLTGAHLEGADLESAYLNGAHLEHAHLERSIRLTQNQVNSALGDKDTHLPAGIMMPESWIHPKGE